ncbi:hypothetical protein [Streptomyces sp. NPDC056632]|uniref:hypothetical protein n=1 Tax=Streptomyces sp. NPDC056632 TaxID=3345884 RepID=UPI00369178E5
MAWPEPPAGLTVGPQLKKLRDTVDAFIYDPTKQLKTDDERAGTALLISLTRTPDDRPINRSEYPNLARYASKAWREFLGLFRVVGIFVTERTEPDEEFLMTPHQLGDAIALKESLTGLTTGPQAAASKLWGTPLGNARKPIVQGVWDGMNWHGNGVLRLFAEAVIEIADQLRRHDLPVKARTISRLIWRDDRADAYQDVVVKSILRTREGGPFRRLRSRVQEFTYDPEGQYATDRDRSSAALLISLKNTSADSAIARSNYLSKLTAEGNTATANAHLTGKFRGVGAFMRKRKTIDEGVMTSSQLRAVMSLHGASTEKGSPVTSADAVKLVWGSSLKGNTGYIRRYVVEGVWAMMNWNDGDVFQDFADAVVEIARQMQDDEEPIDEHGIAKLIWADDRAIEDQVVIVHAILRTREGGPFRRLRSRVQEFTYDPEGQYATDRDRSSAALLISLKNTSADSAIARSNYLSKLTAEGNSTSANAHLTGKFRGVGAFMRKRKTIDEEIMTSSQLRAVMSLHGASTEKGSPVTSADAVKLVWGSSLKGNTGYIRRYVVEGVWAMMNWNDGDVFQDFADAVVEIARQMQDDDQPVDERGIAKLIWADHRAIEDQVVIVHAILRTRGVVEEQDLSTTSPEQAVLDGTDTRVGGSETAGASTNPVPLEEGEDALATGVGQLGITATSPVPAAEPTETGGGLTMSLDETDPDVVVDTDADLVSPGPGNETTVVPHMPVPLPAPPVPVAEDMPGTSGSTGRSGAAGSTSTARPSVRPTGSVPAANNGGRNTTVGGGQAPLDAAAGLKDWLDYELVEQPLEDAPVGKVLTFLVHEVLGVAESGIWHTAREVAGRLRGRGHTVSPEQESTILGLLQGLGLPHVYRQEWGTGPGTAEEMAAVLAATAQAMAAGQPVDPDGIVRAVLPHTGPALRAQATGWATAAQLLRATGDVRLLVTAARQLHRDGDTDDSIISTLLHTPRPTAYQRQALQYWLTYRNIPATSEVKLPLDRGHLETGT